MAENQPQIWLVLDATRGDDERMGYLERPGDYRLLVDVQPADNPTPAAAAPRGKVVWKGKVIAPRREAGR